MLGYINRQNPDNKSQIKGKNSSLDKIQRIYGYGKGAKFYKNNEIFQEKTNKLYQEIEKKNCEYKRKLHN